jgi:hypothetical protein
MEKELARLDKLSDLKLLDLMDRMDKDPAPEWIKQLIYNKINAILNARLGL